MDRRDALVFVYNADGGFVNGLADLAHKTFAPDTYSCNLCKLTYSALGMRRSWKRFLASLDFDLEFLHRDDLRELGLDFELPVILRRSGPDGWRELVPAASLRGATTLGELQDLILRRLAT